jgi:FkbM family methyltransferase
MTLHYQLTRVALALGPTNPIVSLLTRRAVARHGVGVSVGAQAVDLRRDRRILRIAQAQWPYAPSIAASFDSYFGQVEPAVVGDTLVVDYSRPRLQTYRSSGLAFEIASFPEEDTAIADYFRWYEPQAGDLVFDLGAYCGASTYAFAKAVGPTGRVIAFEPDALSYSLLVRNIARHELDNVTPVRAAIAGSTGSGAFNQEGTLGSVLARHSPRATTGRSDTVETLSLTDACARFGVPAFAKIDIEGSEVEVLESSRELLRSHPIQLALDTHHLLDGVRTTNAVERILIECGYETLSSDASGFWTTWARPAGATAHVAT